MKTYFKCLAVLVCLSLIPFSCTNNPVNSDIDTVDKIVFSSRRGGQEIQLYVMNPDGSNIKQLTFLGEHFAYMPNWSPDGTQIVFATSLRATSAGASIYVMDADGGNMRPVATFPNSSFPRYGDFPSWSPDGARIVYVSCFGCEGGGLNTEIFTVDITTGEVTRLTENYCSDEFPSWSPDGTQILFSSDRDTTAERGTEFLYIMDVDGQNQRKLFDTDIVGRLPVWSPSGSRVAFSLGGHSGIKIAIIDMNTQDIHEFSVGVQHLELGGPFSWSPDEKYILAIRYRPIGDELYKIDVENSTSKRVLDDTTISSADWSKHSN